MTCLDGIVPDITRIIFPEDQKECLPRADKKCELDKEYGYLYNANFIRRKGSYEVVIGQQLVSGRYVIEIKPFDSTNSYFRAGSEEYVPLDEQIVSLMITTKPFKTMQQVTLSTHSMRISEERALVFAELAEGMNAVLSAKVIGKVSHSELDDEDMSEKIIEFYDDGIGYDIFADDGVYTALVDLSQDGQPSMISVIASGPNKTATVDRQVYLGIGQLDSGVVEDRVRRGADSLIKSNTQIGTVAVAARDIELIYFQDRACNEKSEAKKNQSFKARIRKIQK